MFEKEAEEYATRECCTTCNNINHFCKEKCECWTFAKKGAEFGYNKANEWHENGYYVEQLTKAKEIIQKLYNIVCGRSGDDWESIKQAEQFLREAEE